MTRRIERKPNKYTLLKNIKFFTVTILILAILTGCYPAMINSEQKKNSSPLIMPFLFLKGNIQPVEFQANQDATYNITLDFEKKIPFEQLDCFTGGPGFRKNGCHDSQSLLSIAWNISENGKVLFTDSFDHGSSGVYGQNHISRGIGSFKAQAGHNYVLHLIVRRDAFELDACNPRLIVRPPNLK